MYFDYEVIASHFKWRLKDIRKLPRRMRLHWAKIAARNMGMDIVKIERRPDLS